MVRVRYNRIAKFAGFVIFLFFLVVIISKTSSNQDSNDDYEADLPHKESHHKEDNDVVEEQKNQNFDRNNRRNRPDNNPELEAVFKQGKLGNYEPRNLEPRTGPGENGEGVALGAKEKVAGLKSVREYGFNMVASGKISLDRRIKDTRHSECKYWSYPELKYLPTASVVLVFHNEGFSTLVRTIHSVINTSPTELIADIILIDDFSTKNDLKDKLEEYIKRWNGIVKIYRTTKREGLIQARVLGAEHSTGEVIIILDAHCECVTNWLPPLLTRIAVNRKTVAVPIVDGIDWNTIAHRSYGGDSNAAIGIWEWGFLYKETQISDADMRKKPHITSPTRSPTHAGGLLAIDKKWFFELGGYDPGIKIWGAEQYELSFKVWQCGGTLEWVPCSKVGHIYRGPRSESTAPRGGNPNQNTINHMRLAEVWMDEYKEYFYIRQPNIRKLDFGDISEQLAIKEKLQCKSFDWYMKNIAYDVVKKFPLPPKNKVWGEVVNSYHKKCMDTNGASFGQPIGVAGCHHHGGSQMFRLNEMGEISAGEHCFVSDKDIVKNTFCLNYQGIWNPIGEWDYDEKTKLIKSNKEKTCISTDGSSLFLDECDESNKSQLWTFNEIFLH